jgi:hypothetical protein
MHEITGSRLLLFVALLFSLTLGLHAQTAPPESSPAAAEAADSALFPHLYANRFWLSGQMNGIYQSTPPFDARYSGPNSLPNSYNKAISRVLTLYTGARLTATTEFLVDVESAGGQGVGSALGLAGFTNLDAVRNPTLGSAPYLARLMLHQVFPLGGGTVEADPGPFSLFAQLPTRRIELRAGKFSTVDFFDLNAAGGDSHMQFLNWTVDNNGAYDYAADTRGYTYGALVEYQDRCWGVRFAETLLPTVANGMDLVWNLRRARAENMEAEWRHGLLPRRRGTVRFLSFVNHANMGRYRYAVDRYLAGQDTRPDITDHPLWTTIKFGFGLNLEQELAADVTAFARIGWNNGRTESYAYTEVDQTAALGLTLGGRRWGRRGDRAGVAFVSNGISRDHQSYLKLGGSGFLLGDGGLSYGREQILEGFYTLRVRRGLFVAPDVQFIVNPGYNRARGPVPVFGLRLHVEL